MDLGFNEQQQMLRDTTRRFLENEFPVAKARETFTDAGAFDPELWRRGAALGWCAPVIPDELGGGSVSGQGVIDLVAIAEEMGRFVFPGPFLATNVVASAIAEFGTDEQRKEVLPGIAAGEAAAAWCLAEPAGVWDAEGVATTARRVGEDVVLDGTKMYIDGAGSASWLLVAARDGDDLVQVLLPASEPGIEVTPLETLDPTRPMGVVTFSGVRAPSTSILGHARDAREAIERQLQIALVLLCADSVGGADRVLEMAVAYAKDREQFGRPIGSFQAIKHKAANMLLWLEASRAATYFAALAVDSRLDEAPLAVSAAKSYVGESTSLLAEEGLQIHGGIGFTWEHDIHLYLRRAKSNEVLYGDPSWHREKVCRIVGV
ncbi:MAG: acyl-CoA dehydrogenase family protein [Actinomycetota bacterium]